MRNYTNELRQAGKSIKQISELTGINKTKISKLSTGEKVLKSGSKEYQIIRNTSRKVAYKKLRDSGLSAKAADKYRRIGISERTYIHKSKRNVKHTEINKKMFQLKMLAEYQNIKTKEKRIIESFSNAYSDIDIDGIYDYANNLDSYYDDTADIIREDYSSAQEMIAEAVAQAQSKLGGSNWELLRIIDVETIEYNIG